MGRFESLILCTTNGQGKWKGSRVSAFSTRKQPSGVPSPVTPPLSDHTSYNMTDGRSGVAGAPMHAHWPYVIDVCAP